MANVQETIRRLTIEAKSPGVQQAANDLKELSSAQAEVAVTAQSQEKATLSAERALERVQRQYDQAYRAEQQLARVERDLAAARSQGLVSIERQAELLDLAKSRISGVIPAANEGTGGFRRFGGAIQQAGYQVGDFAVQIASGTNPLRAFIQQGTQLVSMFGPWGAVIGAAGAVVGALATNFLDLGSSAKSASEDQDTFNKTLEKASEIMDKIRGKTVETTAAVRAQGQALLINARTALSVAESDLRQIPARIGGGHSGASIANPEFVAKQEEIEQLRRQLVLLQADLGQFPDVWDRLLRQPASAAAQSAAEGATTATTATAKLGRTAQATLLSVQDLIDSFDPAAQKFQAVARAEAALDLAYERGTITLAEYTRRLDDLYKTLDAAPAEKATQTVEAATTATEQAETATSRWGDSLTRIGQDGARSLIDVARGATTARDALARLLDVASELFANMAAQGLGDIFTGGSGTLGVNSLKFQSTASPSGGGFLSAIGSFFGSLFGFADGGSFRVGGSGGTDSQLVAFRASPDERVTVTRPGQGEGGPIVINMGGITINSPAGTPEQNQDFAQRNARELKRAVRDAVREEIRAARRPMSLLDAD